MTSDLPFYVSSVLAQARLRPHAPALCRVGQPTITFFELYQKVCGMAARLRAMGVRAGDAVILPAAQSPDFVLASLAVHALGACLAATPPRCLPEHFHAMRKLLQPCLCFGNPAENPEVQDVAEIFSAPANNGFDFQALCPEATADVLFTSGSTDLPKAVPCSQHRLAAILANLRTFTGNGPDDVEISVMPLFHAFGLYRQRCALAAGGAVALVDSVTPPRAFFEAVEMFGVTGMGLTSAAWQALKRFSGDRLGRYAPQLRYMELGSTPLPLEEKRALAALLPHARLVMNYGMTETPRSAVLDFHTDADNLESLGRTSPAVEIAVMDDEGRPLPAGKSGELCMRGPTVMPGYLGRDNSPYFFGPWFRSGEVGQADAKGRFVLVGRRQDIIDVGGEKVSPAQVEQILTTLPEIAEAACLAMPDHLGLCREAVGVLAVAGPTGPKPWPDLAARLAPLLSSAMMPRALLWVEALPRTANGKLDRKALAALKPEWPQ